MKKSIFIFFTFSLLTILVSSCYTTKKGGCNCPGSSQNNIEIQNIDC